MSIPTSLTGSEVNVDRAADKITSKGQIQFTHTRDDNANQLSSLSDEGGQLGDSTSLPPLVSQSESHDKLMIWGSEQQCSEPGLREIELVECQDIHTFLRSPGEDDNDEDDGGSTRDGKDEGPMSISSSSTASSASSGLRRNDNDSNKVESRVQTDTALRGNITCHSTEELDTCVTGFSRERNTKAGRGGLKQSKSETNVFVSNLSTINLSGSLSSALDCSRDTFICLPNSKTNPYLNTNNTTSAQSLRRAAPVDRNTSMLHHQEKQEEEKIQFRNGTTSEGGLGQRRRTGFEERVLPPRRQQLVRPLCQTEMVRAQSLESSAQGAEIGPSPSNITTIVSPSNTHNGSNRKLARSSLREPSDFSHLYNTCGVFQPRLPNQKEVSMVERQPGPAAQSTSNPSKPFNMERQPQTQFTYRRNCSSPKRTFTPPHSPLRTPQGSPHRQASMYLISKDTRRGVQNNPAVKTPAQGNESVRAPLKTNITPPGIPKATPNNQQNNPNSSHNSSPKESSPSPKPKGVRPKIITYVRKNPQFKPQAADGPYQVSSLPARLSAYPHGATPGSFKDTPKDPSKFDKETRGLPVLSASNLLYDKYRKEIQTSIFPSGLMSRSIHAPGYTNTGPPTHTHSYTAPPKLGSKADDSYGAQSEVGRSASFKETSKEDPLQLRTAAQAGGNGSLLRSGRGLRLGLGAVTRTASGLVKGKGLGQSQRSAISQAIQPVMPAASQKSQDTADDEVFSHHPPSSEAPASAQVQAGTSIRSLLPKAASQSGLRPPGFSSTRLPVGHLAAFGFIRSSSVSSVSSVHSADSAQSDPNRTAHRLSVSEEPPLHRVAGGFPSMDHQKSVTCRSNSLQPPSTPALPRRYLPAQPRSSPGVGRKEFQRSSEVTRSLPSSPKRLAVVPPKPQSPVQSGQRPVAGPTTRSAGPPGSPRRVPPLKLQQEKEDAQQRDKARKAEEREKEEQRQEVERLRGRCEEQEKQLRALREELRKTSLGLEVFIVTTQHYCLKNQTAEDNKNKLFLEIQMIKDQLVSNSTHWERLKLEKSAVEAAFERELQELQVQQEAERAAVEENLRKCHSAETENLKAEHQSDMEELRTQQQEQVEEMTAHHQAAVQELRDRHNITMATLHEEHARTMRDLRKAHEQQKMLREEDFEKLRLSLQDQVDTLTFQNHSLRDKAKRFEEALRKSTDEQIVDALAPYQHIDKDLKSLKEVVEMKNQQIHQQDLKISDLQKVAQKNVFLEEKIQVLQQQNEDLKARIEMNLTLSRQLSEENANLQESVEKESTEKKRLSRNNEELLWRLQTSPLMSPSSSPLHRSFSTSPIPSSPLFSSSPVPPMGCHSPAHCQGCPQQLQSSSPFHTANHSYSLGPATPTHQAPSNQNYSPGPATPTHRAAETNQNYSPGPATPTHRAAATNQNCSPGPATPTHRAAATNQNYSPGPCTPTHRAAATNQNYSPGPCTPTHRETANRNSAACLALQR